MAEHQDHHDHHKHEHGHDHTHGHDKSHTDINRSHWDEAAKDYTATHTQKEFGNLLNKVTESILFNISNIGVDFLDPASEFEKTSTKSVRVLDYACGPGTITNALAGRASEFIGIDISPKMVEEYNARFDENAHAYVGDLCGQDISKELDKFTDFDLAAVGLGFHHFENLPRVTQRLVDRLKPGGVLMIIDFFTHDKGDMAGHAAAKTVSHHGFSESQINSLFGHAGLSDIKVIPFEGEVLLRGTATRKVFMACGTKSSNASL